MADVLLGRREARLARAGTRKRSTATLTRQQRLQLAPRPPRASALVYTRFLVGILEDIKAKTRDILLPALPQLVGQSSGVTAQPDPLHAQLGARRDCGCAPAPLWLLSIRQDAERTVFFRGPWRTRGAGGVYSERFGQLEVALSEITSPARLVRTLQEVASGLDAHNRAELTRVLQINLRDDQSLRVFIDGFLRENTRLIQSVAHDQLDRMERVVSRSTAGQVRVEDLRDEILATFDVSESRAALIARDQTLKANADLTQLRQQRVGVTDYIWTTAKDERVRGRPGGKWDKSQSDHWALEGTRQTWLEPPITNPVTGERNHPGRDYQCRCVAFPITDQLLEGL